MSLVSNVTTCDYQNETTNFDSYISIVKLLTAEDNDLDVLVHLSIMLLKLKHKFDKTLHPTAISEFILACPGSLVPLRKISTVISFLHLIIFVKRNHNRTGNQQIWHLHQLILRLIIINFQ